MPPDSPPGAPVAPAGPPAGRSTPWPRWIVYAAVVVAALLGGAVTGTAVTLALDDGPRDGYVVTVFLTAESTADQKAAVESALSRVYPAEGVRRQDREQTLESLRDDHRRELGTEATAEVAESFRVELAGPSIDCAALAPVGKMPGVQLVMVVQPLAEGRPHALLLECP